jgi:anaerobic carbon-monoxide dehydrogenase iron sulfur subunit
MRLVVADRERCVGCQCCMFACTRRQNLAGLNRSCIGVRSEGGIERGMTVVVCRACPDPPCLKVCPVDALSLRKGGGVLLNPELCIGCGNCRDECILSAVFWDEESNKPCICIHCGYCAKYCPHDVLAMDKGN